MYKNKYFLFCAVTAILVSGNAHAGKNVTSPYVEKGATEIEAKSGYILEDDNGGEDAWESEVSAAYGVTDFWEAEAGVVFEDAGRGEDAEMSGVFIESKFQLAKPGIFFVDPAIKVEYEHSVQGEADEIGAELILAKAIAGFDNTANFEIGREVGEKSEDETEYGFAYALSREVAEDFALGVEWYSDFGNFEDGWDDQSHQIGPVVYGAAPFGLEYEAGILAGVSDSAPDAELKLIVGYEF